MCVRWRVGNRSTALRFAPDDNSYLGRCERPKKIVFSGFYRPLLIL